jgi:hypothetical protein
MCAALVPVLTALGCSSGDAVADGDLPGDYDAWDGNVDDGDLDGDSDADNGEADWERWEEGDITYERLADEVFLQWRSEQFAGNDTQVPHGVTSIQPWVNGGAYIGAANGLWRYNPLKPVGQQLYKVANPDGIEEMAIIGMALGDENALYVLISSTETDSFLARMRYEDELRLAEGCILGQYPTAIAALGESQWIYIGTSGPVYFFNGTDCTSQLTQEWPQGGIRAMSGTHDGRMAILQYKNSSDYVGFIFNVFDNKWFSYKTTDGLAESAQMVSLFAVDYPEMSENRDIWIAHSSGLQQYTSRRELVAFGGGVCAAGQDSGCGLPWDELRDVAVDRDGGLWAATTRGVIMRPAAGEPFKLFQSRRWLVDNEPTKIGFDQEGTIWVGHAGGVTHFYRESLTLKQKADAIQAIHDERHVRMDAFSVPALLTGPGVLDDYSHKIDPEEALNTALYALSQTFRAYVAKAETERTEAARNAWAAIKGLTDLIEATGYDEIPEIDGLPARAILPRGDGPVGDADAGEWNRSDSFDWLGDPGKPAVLAHVLAYGVYFDLIADNNQKALLKKSIKRLTDHLIRNGYRLIDLDAQPTSDGLYNKEAISGATGQLGYGGVTALQLLTLLRVTYHLTGDETYWETYIQLGLDNGYVDETRHQKTYSALRQADPMADQMAYLSYLPLLRYEDRVSLRDVYTDSLDEAWRLDRNSRVALFNLVYGVTNYSGFDLEQVVEALQEHPLDLVDWRIDSCWRKDVALADSTEAETASLLAGVLPLDEQMLRDFGENPHACAWSGDDDADLLGGRTERDGTSFLLPYWMARAYRMLDAAN